MLALILHRSPGARVKRLWEKLGLPLWASRKISTALLLEEQKGESNAGRLHPGPPNSHCVAWCWECNIVGPSVR